MENTQFAQTDIYDRHEEQAKAVEHIVETQRPVIVELTSKKYKGMMLWGNFVGFAGVFFFFFTFSDTAQKIFSIGTGVTIAVIMFGLGLITHMTGKALAWWHHG